MGMTAVAWAILMYAAVAYPDVKLNDGGNTFLTIGFTAISLLTLKELFR